MKRLASCQKKEMLNLVFNNIDLNCSNISMIAAIYSSDLYYKYNINRCLQQDYNNNIYILFIVISSMFILFSGRAVKLLDTTVKALGGLASANYLAARQTEY